MNDTTTFHESDQLMEDKPGAYLAAHRDHLNYSQEYVADKLHLRVQIIELLENDDYENMPEPVFIKGYLRAYAKLLGVSPEPLLSSFNELHAGEQKIEKALWQSRRETNKAENAIRWLTTVFAVVVLIAVAVWWQTNKESEHIFSSNYSQTEKTSAGQSEKEIRLTDLSKMRSLLSSSAHEASLGES
jgi:cytoskeleton protein RodZ